MMDQDLDQDSEFEMKPLTPGLGFHKRQVSLKEHMAKTGLVGSHVSRSLPIEPPPADLISESKSRTSKEIIAELHEALKPPTPKKESVAVQLTEILPRDISDVPVHKRPTPDTNPLEKINFQIPDKSLAEPLGARRGGHDNLINPITPISVSFESGLLDGAIVLAVSLIFLISLIMVTGVDLLSVIHSSRTEFTTQLSLLVLYLAVLEMYVIVSRSFFGMTIGEWTFDLQLGEDEQIARASYPAKVFLRSVLILLTGVVIVPVLSLILNRDIVGRLIGLQLYRRNI